MAKKAPSTPPKPIRIEEVRRTRKTIYVGWYHGEDWHDIDCRDNPLPEFNQAFDQLPALVCQVMGVPESYATNMRPLGIKVGNIGGADTVSLFAQREVPLSSKVMQFATPAALLLHPTEPGSYSQPLSDDEAAPVLDLIEAAKQYILGNRAQGQLEFEGGEEEDDGSGTEPKGEGDQTRTLPFEQDPPDEPEAEEESPKRKSKRVQINDGIRSDVKRHVEAGLTDAEVAKRVGISLSSVTTIKRALGMVQSRR